MLLSGYMVIGWLKLPTFLSDILEQELHDATLVDKDSDVSDPIREVTIMVELVVSHCETTVNLLCWRHSSIMRGSLAKEAMPEEQEQERSRSSSYSLS